MRVKRIKPPLKAEDKKLPDKKQTIISYTCREKVYTALSCPNVSVQRIAYSVISKWFKGVLIRIEQVDPEGREETTVTGKRLITEVLCKDLPCTALMDTAALVSLIALSTFEKLLSVMGPMLSKGFRKSLFQF